MQLCDRYGRRPSRVVGVFFLLIGRSFIFMKAMSKIKLNTFVRLSKIRKRKTISHELLHAFIWIVRKYFLFLHKWGHHIILTEMNFCLVNVYLKYKIFRNKYIADTGRMVHLCVWHLHLYEFCLSLSLSSLSVFHHKWSYCYGFYEIEMTINFV